MTTTYKTDPRAFALIEGKALDLAGSGARRISVKKLMEDVRAQYQLTINNTDAPAIADRLIVDHPALDDLIVRRARGRRGPNKAQSTNDFDKRLVHVYRELSMFVGRAGVVALAVHALTSFVAEELA